MAKTTKTTTGSGGNKKNRGAALSGFEDSSTRESRKMDLPSWMDEKNDNRIVEEQQPLLFGTGNVLQDSNDDKDPERGTDQSGYGSSVQPNEIKPVTSGEAVGNDVIAPSVSISPTNYKKPEKEDDSSRRSRNVPTKIDTKAKPATTGGGRGKRKQSTTESIASASSSLTASNRPHIPKQNFCLWIFYCINGTAIVSGLSLIMTQLLPLITDSKSQVSSLSAILGLLLNVYISLFCILFILVELDVPISTLRNSSLLQAYFSRGFLYSFLGLICTVEADSNRVGSLLENMNSKTTNISWLAIFMQVSAWVMCCVGVVYMVLGLCCLERLRHRMREDEREAWRQYRVALRQWKLRG